MNHDQTFPAGTLAVSTNGRKIIKRKSKNVYILIRCQMRFFACVTISKTYHFGKSTFIRPCLYIQTLSPFPKRNHKLFLEDTTLYKFYCYHSLHPLPKRKKNRREKCIPDETKPIKKSEAIFPLVIGWMKSITCRRCADDSRTWNHFHLSNFHTSSYSIPEMSGLNFMVTENSLVLTWTRRFSETERRDRAGEFSFAGKKDAAFLVREFAEFSTTDTVCCV